MEISGTFTDSGNPGRFVWLRGFADMESRARALGAFYGGPVWKKHREAANATMLDSDNVLLLRPAWPDAGFRTDGVRASIGATKAPPGVVVAAICYFAKPIAGEWLAAFREQPHAGLVAAMVTEPAPNTFPALPVRENEHVFVSFSVFDDLRRVGAVVLPPGLERAVMRLEVLRLLPTPRSRRYKAYMKRK